MKKKIGLAVCYDTKNFGSQLQVLATIKKVEEIGLEPEIIQYKKKLTPKFILQTVPRLFNPYFVGNKLKKSKKNKEIKKHPKIASQIKIRERRFEEFARVHFQPYIKSYGGWENLVKGTSAAYDGFLCGSDQLWLPANLGSHFYTLEFAPDDKAKIAYATSFGVKQIPWYQKKKTARYLNRFQALSTRELAGREIIRSLTGKEAEVVCDPTLLMSAEEWSTIIPSKSIIGEPYIFCYFLGTNQEHREFSRLLQKRTGYKMVSIPFLDEFTEMDRDFSDMQLFDVDSGDFVNLIRYAEYIVTDSFHGTVFSILHHKKFMTFNRFSEGANSRNSRIDSLCSILELNNRRFDGNIEKIFDDIDYDRVEKNLNVLRSNSVHYLKKSMMLF